MSRFKRLSHSIYDCKYHIVFCPKYRYKIFKSEIAEYVVQQIYGLCSAKDKVEVLELNVQADHVHLIVEVRGFEIYGLSERQVSDSLI